MLGCAKSYLIHLEGRVDVHSRIDRFRIVIGLAAMIPLFSQFDEFLLFTDLSTSPQKVHILAPKRVFEGAAARS
jgi:hypothetical protein